MERRLHDVWTWPCGSCWWNGDFKSLSERSFILNIDVLTYGHEFKDDNGNIYSVTTHLAENDKINIELQKKVGEVQEDKLIDES
jgi:hypothetical protein